MRPYQYSVGFRKAGPPTALQASFLVLQLPQLLGEPRSQVRSALGQRPQRHDPVQSSSGRHIPARASGNGPSSVWNLSGSIEHLGQNHLIGSASLWRGGWRFEDTDHGERFMRTMTSMLIKNGICPVLTQVFSIKISNLALSLEPFAKWTQVNVFLYGAEISSFQIGIFILYGILKDLKKPVAGKVWIIAACWDLTWDFMESSISIFRNICGIFSFLVQTNKRVAFGAFKQFHSSMKHFVEKSFTCSSIKDALSVKVWRQCREKEELRLLPQGDMQQILSLDSFFTYNIIWAVGLALHSAYFSRSKRPLRSSGENLGASRLKTWQVFWSTTQFQSIKSKLK